MDQEGTGLARGDRATVTRSRTSRQAVEAVWRMESARIVSTLAGFTGDFTLAEDLAQEALAEALVGWRRDGVPRNPAGWLPTVGRRELELAVRLAGNERERGLLQRKLAAPV